MEKLIIDIGVITIIGPEHQALQDALDISKDQLKALMSIDTNVAALVGGNTANIPSYDVGTRFVAHDTLARVHKGEKITPARVNMAEGGETQMIIYMNIYGGTSKEVARMCKEEFIKLMNGKGRVMVRATARGRVA